MPFQSPYPAVDIPDVTVYDYLFGDLSDDNLERVAVYDSATGAETT